MRKKRILMIIPTLAGGGAERVVSNLTLKLKDKYDVDILLDYDNVEYPYSGKIIQLNPNVKNVKNIWNEMLTYVRKYMLLRKMKRLKAYDCYVSHSDISNIINVITGNKDCNVILTLHSAMVNMDFSRISSVIKLFAKYNYRKADKIVAVSEGLKKEYIREFKIPKKKIVGIWNGNDVNLIQCKKNASIPEKEKSWLVSDRTVVTMGRLSEEKGQIHLLHAFSQVVKKIPDARLLLLGDGPLKDKLIKGARQLGIEDNVFFCGFQENPFSILAKSDLFVFTSLYEGYGYALAEAICCGIPCITTDFEYGAREILRYQDNAIIKDAVYTDYGVLVPVCKDSSDNDITREEMILAESIIQMLSDREYRNNVVMNNLKRLDDFSIERMGEKWEQVLEDR